MDSLDDSLIKEFLMLGFKIDRMKIRIAELDSEFFSIHSFMASPMAVDEAGNRVGSVMWPKLVEDLVISEQTMIDSLGILQYESMCFNKYFGGLSDAQKSALTGYYIHNNCQPEIELNQQTLDEIHEILEATAWRFGLEPDIYKGADSSTRGGIDEMLNLLEVIA